jgi:hypothetical protein
MFEVAGLIAASLVLAFVLERALVLALSLVAFAGLTALVPWPFARDDVIMDARDFILTGGTPPRVFYSESDPQRLIFISIASALTDHVVHDHYRNGGHATIAAGDKIALLDSRVPSTPFDTSPCVIEGLRPIAARQFDRRYLAVGVHLFEATTNVPQESLHCPSTAHDGSFSIVHRYAGAELPTETGEVVGESRVATAGKSASGFMTYGPMVALEPGRYLVTLRYAAKSAPGAPHQWDVVVTESAEDHAIANALLPETEGKPGTLAIGFVLPKALDRIEVRMFFSGAGELSVSELTIERQRP